MRPLPNTSTTVLNCPFNGSLADISGNGLHPTVENGVESYSTFDACTSAFNFASTVAAPGGSGLICPASSLLRITGELTIQVTTRGNSTVGQVLLGCTSPSDPYRGVFRFFIYSGFLFDGTFYNDSFVFSDANTSQTYIGYPGASVTWDPWGVAGATGVVTFRRALVGGSHQYSVFVNGILAATGPTVPVTTAYGDERLRIGEQTDGAVSLFSGQMANLRIDAAARTDAQILADATWAMEACGGVGTGGPGGSTVGQTSDGAADPYLGSVALAADTGRIYRYAPGHMPQLKGNR